MRTNVTAITTPAGDPAWLARGYATVKTLLADSRLGRSHPSPEKASRYTDAAVLGKPQGTPETERAEHAVVRRLLARSFSARRLAGLRPRVQDLVDGLLDRVEKAGPPVDLHEMLAFPLPALVICELLGVPYEDREDFRRWSDDLADMSDRARSEEAEQRLQDYMKGLLDRKRIAPAEDVLSDLLAFQRSSPESLSDERIVTLAAGLLFAGHETTVAAIDRGVLLLLLHPEQRAALEADPDLVPSAVEEILRLPNPVPGGPPSRIPRYANGDIDVGGTLIRAGDLVVLDLENANLDESAFKAAADFDITRPNNAHVAFGHGPHYCIGAPLARIELQAVFGTLFRRFPNLRLAVPFEELRPRDTMLTGGVHELPVSF